MRENLAGDSHDIYIQGTGQPNGHSIVYNPAGQIVSLVRTNDIYAWNGHFNVDRSYARNGLNQLTSAGATALGYDGRGNLTSSGSDAYSYTSENRLATGPGGTSLWYDPTGRISKLTKGAVTKKYEHLGPRLVIERDASGTIVNRYVHGPGDDEPVVWYVGSALTTKRWLHTDERGSVIAVSDASGLATAVNRYDEYGIPAATNNGTFQYTGQMRMPELGLYYYKARMYSPTLGRSCRPIRSGMRMGSTGLLMSGMIRLIRSIRRELKTWVRRTNQVGGYMEHSPKMGVSTRAPRTRSNIHNKSSWPAAAR